ncbi:YWP1 [Cyberlindnera jadinii]|uniref:YWP1 protein n=1 Tax=Cyberlindnera jadinii (strain ATCC 18201 / CBS 1600 / BCRC 20928 / JCM 3617 / NBRC 0987 / NRRL Y-1542) TaxID=983966 RepID=A0A0H5C4I1_CYBJN|nr:YWP1 [Cyberlindnera jadinii]
MFLRSLIPLALALATASAESYSIPVSFDQILQSYSYFPRGSAVVEANADGLEIVGDFADDAAACDALDGAQIIYYADDQSGILLTSNCYNVYYMEDTSKELLTWDSCEEFPFYESLCGVESSTCTSTHTVSPDTSRTGAITKTSDESAVVIVDRPAYTVVQITTSTVYTTRSDGVVTSYTTVCPVKNDVKTTVVTITSCEDQACTEVPVTTGATVVTSEFEGALTSYTTYCPLPSSVPQVIPTATSTTTEHVAETTGEVTTEGATTEKGDVAATTAATTEVTTEGAAEGAAGETTTVVNGETVTVAPAAAVTTTSIPVVEAQSTSEEAGETASATIVTFEGKGSKLTALSALAIAGVVALF